MLGCELKGIRPNNFGKWRVESAHKDKALTWIDLSSFRGEGRFRGTIGGRWMRKKGIQWSPVEFNFWKPRLDRWGEVSWVESTRVETCNSNTFLSLSLSSFSHIKPTLHCYYSLCTMRRHGWQRPLHPLQVHSIATYF